MDANLRIVTHLPIRELWRGDGFSASTRGTSLSQDDIRRLLASGPVQFVIADVGIAPHWVAANECLKFWKNEAESHLASDVTAVLDEFPGGYCYFASLWEGPEQRVPIIVLEKHH